MPRVSVLTITWRLGGFDLLAWGLDAQVFRDFDLVVVDALHPWRAEAVDRWAVARRFPVRHLGDGRAPSDSGHRESTAYNTGLDACGGEYVLFLNDWTVLGPEALARHLEVARPGVVSLADYSVHDAPAGVAHPEYAALDGVGAGGDAVAAYEALVRGLLEGSPLWIESAAVRPAKLLGGLGARTRGRFTPGAPARGWTAARYAHLKNELYPRAAIDEAGGFDLAYDGAHGYMDADLGRRLAAQGVKFWSDDVATALHIDPRRWMRTMENARWRESEARFAAAGSAEAPVGR